MSDTSQRSPVTWFAIVRQFVRHEWLWLAVVSMAVSGVTMLSLYGANPRFHEVWYYTPGAVPTLAFIESVIHQKPVYVPSNHMTWFGVWVLQYVIPTPKWIVIVLYVGATGLTAVTTYVMFRALAMSIPLAMLGACAFALLPGRFVQPMLAMHWWIIMPVAMWWSIAWWEGRWMHLRGWQWLWLVPTIVVCALLGASTWWWASVVIVVSAILACIIHRTWHPLVLAVAMSGSAWVMLTALHLRWPIPPLPGDGGLRLSAFWIPPADHRIPWLAQLGRDFAALDVVHTSATYIGGLACVGLAAAVVHTVLRSAGIGPNTTIHRLVLVLGSVIIIANQRGLALLAPVLSQDALSTVDVDVWVGFIGITVAVIGLQHYRIDWRVIGVIGIVVLIDHVPQTNIMYQMMQRTIDVPVTRTWQDGIWFGQSLQSDDVVAITGMGDIEPGYGRWSDAAVAERVHITLNTQVPATFILEIRARGVGVNVGVPVIVQIGDVQQAMVLSEVITTQQLSFAQATGNTITIYPQPVNEPPAGDSRLIGVFVQSMRIHTP